MSEENLWVGIEDDLGSGKKPTNVIKSETPPSHNSSEGVSLIRADTNKEATLRFDLPQGLVKPPGPSKVFTPTHLILEDLWGDIPDSMPPSSSPLSTISTGTSFSALEAEIGSSDDTINFQHSVAESDQGASGGALEGDFWNLEGFELIDVEAELAEQAQLEAEASQQAEGEEPGRHGRVQAPGWMGSSTVLYIDWQDQEKAEQEALERLGYAKLIISESTRAFIIQAARAAKLTRRREKDLTSELAAARTRLAQLLDEDSYEVERSTLKDKIAAIEQTLVSNLQWVAVKRAPRFLGNNVELDDLIQAGILGVIAGIRHFDNRRGTRLLVAVNWWVFQALTRAVMNEGRLIYLPVYIHESLAQIKKQRIQLEMQLGRLPTDQELATAAPLSIMHLSEYLQADRAIVSLERYISAEHAHEGYSFQPIKQASLINSWDDEIEQISIKQEVGTLLGCLSPRRRLVMELLYGIETEDEHTLEEVGQVLRVTRERVRQIEEKALRKMGLQRLYLQERAYKNYLIYK